MENLHWLQEIYKSLNFSPREVYKDWRYNCFRLCMEWYRRVKRELIFHLGFPHVCTFYKPLHLKGPEIYIHFQDPSWAGKMQQWLFIGLRLHIQCSLEWFFWQHFTDYRVYINDCNNNMLPIKHATKTALLLSACGFFVLMGMSHSHTEQGRMAPEVFLLTINFPWWVTLSS